MSNEQLAQLAQAQDEYCVDFSQVIAVVAAETGLPELVVYDRLCAYYDAAEVE